MKEIESETWIKLPHILCERLYPDRIMNLSQRDWNIAMQVNDMATARELAIQNQGWALLPCYSVQREIEMGDLVMMRNSIFAEEKYGIWWLRERKYLEATVKKTTDWLKGVSLSI